MKPLIKSRSTGPGNAQSLRAIYAAAAVTTMAPVGVGRTEATAGAAEARSSSSEGNINVGLGGRMKALLINFFRTTSVHGFVNTVQVGVHFIERWVVGCVCGCYSIPGSLFQY